MEIWKDIPGYENLYQVSTCARVKSLSKVVIGKDGRVMNYKEKILKGSLRGDYRGFMLYNGKTRKTYFIHVLLMMTFRNYKPLDRRIVIDHIDNNPYNNNLNNLQVISQRKNSIKNTKRGKSKYVGVCLDKRYNKWIARINFRYKVKYLGSFDTEYKAHLAYKKALLKHEQESLS